MPKSMAAKGNQTIESMIEELQDDDDDENLSKTEYQTATAHYLATQNEWTLNNLQQSSISITA